MPTKPLRAWAALALALAASVTAVPPLVAQPGRPREVPAPPPLRDGQHDFDFLQGSWSVTYRRTLRPLAGGVPAFESWTGHAVFRVTPDGQRVVEESEVARGDSGRTYGTTLMLYAPATRRWTIHQTDPETGTLNQPLVGSFAATAGNVRVGEFYGQQDHAGRAVFVRLRWRLVGVNRAQAELAFSAFGGEQWESIWTSDLTRVGDVPERRAPPRPAADDTLGLTPYERVLDRASRAVNGADPPVAFCCGALDVRQYTVPPGGRDVLLTLFDRENALVRKEMELRGYALSQAPTWMENIALLRDIDRGDRYVWLRALGYDFGTWNAAFYAGSLWAAHVRDVEGAKITIGEPLVVGSIFFGDGLLLGPRPVRDSVPARGIIVATVYTVPDEHAITFASFFLDDVGPRVQAAGARVLGRLASNTTSRELLRGLEDMLKPKLIYERQPFIWLAWFPDAAAYDSYRTRLERDPVWNERVRPALERRLAAPTQVWRLAPIGRSRPIL
jgi:hypothetical protein